MNFKILTSIIITILCGAGLTAYITLSESSTTSQNISKISNIKSGTNITYQITDKNNKRTTKNIIIDETGEGTLPLSYNHDDIINISWNENSAPIQLNIKSDEGLKITGTGLNKFSDIEIKQNDQKEITKADWAGEFEYTLPNLKKETDTVEVAFLGKNFLPKNDQNHPLTVKIGTMVTTGGGGATADGVNEFSIQGCGSPTLSSCDNLSSNTNAITQRYPMALQDMSKQIISTAMYYVQIIGTFMDAKLQLQTQEQIQKLNAQAHKDYQPSEQICAIGTFSKDLAKTQESMNFSKMAFNKIMMDVYTNAKRVGFYNPNHTHKSNNIEERITQFRQTYCDPRDLNDGMESLCKHKPQFDLSTATSQIGAEHGSRIDNDIDYIRTVETPLTLHVNFTDDSLYKTDLEPADKDKPKDHDFSQEEDIIALARNLYWPVTFLPGQPYEDFYDYLHARNIITMSNIAHNSFANIVAMKSEGPKVNVKSGRTFMKEFMKEFGLSNNEVTSVLGDNPSYYAQMEILTKKLYQHPGFYTNLYDKPANVKRIKTAMEAIRLMQLREQFKSNLRKEMVTSVLVERQVQDDIIKVNQSIGSLKSNQ